jgi:hypothetical protein
MVNNKLCCLLNPSYKCYLCNWLRCKDCWDGLEQGSHYTMRVGQEVDLYDVKYFKRRHKKEGRICCLEGKTL